MTVQTYHGKPCKQGHTKRYRSNQTCIECSRVYAAEKAKTRPSRAKSPRKLNLPDRPKECRYCEQIKPPEAFYVTVLGYLTSYCRPCRIENEISRQKVKRLLAKTLGKPLENVLGVSKQT